jgi:hypothetical protein
MLVKSFACMTKSSGLVVVVWFSALVASLSSSPDEHAATTMAITTGTATRTVLRAPLGRIVVILGH